MTRTDWIQRIGNEWAFVRYMPVAKLARRARLDIKRRLRDRIGTPPDRTPAPPVADRPPLPLFGPRRGLCERAASGQLAFTFLNRRIVMPGAVIDWTAPSAASADQLWRMNLHYMEYLEATDDAALSQLIPDWIAANPAGRRGVWRDAWNSYALSIRVVVWMQQLAARGGRIDDDIRAIVHASLGAQLRFLERNLETDLGGNHLIKNVKALLWASAYVVGPEAARWRRLGLDLLQREIAAQILADGMHYERSPSYHCQVFADLLECRHVLGGQGTSAALDRALHAMAEVTADLAHPDGRVALFNDAGLDMAYDPVACLDVYQRLFDRRPGPRAVFALPAAGYYGRRSADAYFVADCGRIAPDDLPAHGHGDVLSFEWSVAGRRIIVDQGGYEYNAGSLRQQARSAASHNTLCLEGSDQAGFFGAFRCGRRPNVEVRRYEPRADGFVLEGTHDGFSHLPGRPRHVRRFEVGPREVRIRDCIEGHTDRPARVTLLLHPEVAVKISGQTARLTCGAVEIDVTATGPLAIERAVWWPDMGHEQPSSRLVHGLGAVGGTSEIVMTVVGGTNGAGQVMHNSR